MTLTWRPLVIALSLSGLALGPVACGKSKSAEAEEKAKAEAVEEADTHAAEEADTTEASDKDTGEHSAKPGENEIDPNKRRVGRDRMGNRRPQPVRAGRDLKEIEVRPSGEVPADGATGEPAPNGEVPGNPDGELGREPTAKPPEVAAPPVANPTAPTPTPEPGIGGTPVAPGVTVSPDVPQGRVEAVREGILASLDASKLLTLESVVEITQAKGLAPAGPLPGIAIEPGYVSMYFASPVANRFGISMQVWQDPTRRESDDRFLRMRHQYPASEQIAAMNPTKAFFSSFGGIQTLTFADTAKRVVASIGCGEDTCTHEQLLKLSKALRDRL